MKSSANRTDLVESETEIRRALDSYRSDPELKPFLNEGFLQRMVVFGANLSLWGAKTNLTAHPGDAIETAFHIIDSLMALVVAHRSGIDDLAAAFGADRRVLDFGSGAGFPGLILAAACEAHFVLAEARHKRASFLKVVAAEMGLPKVEILAGRLTDAASIPGHFDTVLSRASGPSAALFEFGSHILRPGGFMVVYSTPFQRLDLAAAQNAGLSSYRRLNYRVRRGAESVERVLVVWRKQKNSQ